jgi:TPP-dependent pyruvate/acetoin dehydrogenase alpha subunit
MRMKGHAIHDAADYVPKPVFEYWRKRDPIARFETYLVNVKKWLSAREHADLVAEVDAYLEKEREIAVNSPMPEPESAEGGVYCEDGCHEIKPKYGVPKAGARQVPGRPKARERKHEPALHFK